VLKTEKKHIWSGISVLCIIPVFFISYSGKTPQSAQERTSFTLDAYCHWLGRQLPLQVGCRTKKQKKKELGNGKKKCMK